MIEGSTNKEQTKVLIKSEKIPDSFVKSIKEQVEKMWVPLVTSSIEIKSDNHIVLKYKIHKLGQIQEDVVAFDIMLMQWWPEIRLHINTWPMWVTLDKKYSTGSETVMDEVAKWFFSFIKRFMFWDDETPWIIDKWSQDYELRNKIYSDANTAFVWLTEWTWTDVRIEKIASWLVEIDLDTLNKYAIWCKEKDGKIVLYSVYKWSNREKYFPIVWDDALSFANQFIFRVLEDGSRLKQEIMRDPAKKQSFIMKLMKVHYLAHKLPHYTRIE